MQTEQAEGSIVDETLDQSRVGQIGKRLIHDVRALEPAAIVDNTRDWTRENPLAALGIALGAGLLLGIAIRSASATESAVAVEPTVERETARHRLANAVRKSSNELAHKAKQASDNVVSEISSKLSTVEIPALETAAKETASFADTVIASLTATVSRKLSDWLKNR